MPKLTLNVTSDFWGRWYVPVTITQGGEDYIGQFILDNDAKQTVIDSSALKDYLSGIVTYQPDHPLEVEQTNGGHQPALGLVELDAINLGGLLALPGGAFPIADIVRQPEVLGVLGQDYLDDFTQTYHRENSTLTLEF